MTDKETIREMLFAIGIGSNAKAHDYANEPIRFLLKDELVSFQFKGDSPCFHINDVENRVMWYSQFNGIYFSFDKQYH